MLPIVAASCNNKNQKETEKENKNKNIVDTIPSDNTHSANNSSSKSDKSKNADNADSNSNSNVNNSANNSSSKSDKSKNADNADSNSNSNVNNSADNHNSRKSDKSKNADNADSNSNSNVNNSADNHNSRKSDTENTERSSSDNKNNMQIYKYGLKIINEKAEDSVKITTIDSELKDFILKTFKFYYELTPLVIKLKSKDIETKKKHNDIFTFWKEFGRIIDSKSLLNEIFKKEDEKAVLLERIKEYESETRSKVLELIKEI